MLLDPMLNRNWSTFSTWCSQSWGKLDDNCVLDRSGTIFFQLKKVILKQREKSCLFENLSFTWEIHTNDFLYLPEKNWFDHFCTQTMKMFFVEKWYFVEKYDTSTKWRNSTNFKKSKNKNFQELSRNNLLIQF